MQHADFFSPTWTDFVEGEPLPFSLWLFRVLFFFPPFPVRTKGAAFFSPVCLELFFFSLAPRRVR